MRRKFTEFSCEIWFYNQFSCEHLTKYFLEDWVNMLFVHNSWNSMETKQQIYQYLAFHVLFVAVQGNS